ncbi:MAG: DUF2088 domain-containing protein [Deltaproteobacteria bacterium]|nr:DUF2088 domain-containing protein [Deltaproteobacteria bacterium]
MPFGKIHLEFELLRARTVAEVLPTPGEPLAGSGSAVADAMAHLINTRPLQESTWPGCRVCIVFTGNTRACPDHVLVPALLRELEGTGVGERRFFS